MNEVISVSQAKLTHSTRNEKIQGNNVCPLSYSEGMRLLRKTLANHIFPQYWDLIVENGYYFCPDEECPVIYFYNQDQLYFSQQEIRTPVMHKQKIGVESRPACYCKNVSEKQIITELKNNSACKTLDDVKNFTEANTGKDCAITNPTGRCCGKKIKEIINSIK